MSERFASGKHSVAICDRCGFEFKLTELRHEIVKTKRTGVKVCRTCWDPDHPQLMQGMYPVSDPQAVRGTRPDTTYLTSGLNAAGYPGGGSQQIQWGWNPVGGARYFGGPPNPLVLIVEVGTVTVVTT